MDNYNIDVKIVVLLHGYIHRDVYGSQQLYASLMTRNWWAKASSMTLCFKPYRISSVRCFSSLALWNFVW